MAATVQHLEGLLRARKLDSTLLRPGRFDVGTRVRTTGTQALDDALLGGWRQGEISELVGGRSSGRTTTMMRTLAAATVQGGIVGVVDTLDRFDPASASAAGVDLARLLWVRGPTCTPEMARPSVIDLALHQAIRAFDLLVRAGGFSVIALDLADVPALFLRALPATTWMRLARVNEGQDTVCLILASAPVTRSARGVSVRLEARSAWSGGSAQSRRLGGLVLKATLGQSRIGVDRLPDWTLGQVRSA
jgi:hypothetical protein